MTNEQRPVPLPPDVYAVHGLLAGEPLTFQAFEELPGRQRSLYVIGAIRFRRPEYLTSKGSRLFTPHLAIREVFQEITDEQIASTIQSLINHKAVERIPESTALHIERNFRFSLWRAVKALKQGRPVRQ